MNILVFGANGKVGSKLVARLLADGHQVRAFVHSPSKFTAHKRLTILRGDIHSQADVRKAIGKSELVISTLGSWGTKTKDILSTGMENIIPAMEASDARRIISLTGAGALDTDDRPSIFDNFTHQFLKITAGKILDDGERHIALLRASNLDWTVIRAPVMRDGRKSGYEFVHKIPRPWATIKRDDVVEAIIQLMETDTYKRSAPFIRPA